jgi:hypothetical protein
MVSPIVVGSGKRLFREGSDTKVLRLVETETFGSGVVLTYQPAGKEEEVEPRGIYVATHMLRTPCHKL